RHLFTLTFGLIAFGAALAIPYQQLRRHGRGMILVSLLLLILVLIFLPQGFFGEKVGEKA
ncbi:MAG: hypothetical protein ACE5IM_13640, partial [Nitrospinota bacterium]